MEAMAAGGDEARCPPETDYVRSLGELRFVKRYSDTQLL
jgi:hypothetical protein